MKLNSIHYGEDEEIASVAVTMTLDEVAFLSRLTGGLSPLAIEQGIGGGSRWSEASTGVYDCLTNVMNREFDDGTNDVVPRAKGRLQWVTEAGEQS